LSASEYANPWNAQAIIKQLDVVLLSAAEIDLDFHVNVTTDSLGRLIGGSGGHADTAAEAKVPIITTNLLKARQSMIQKRVRTLTTPGNTIDVVVTERGIAIHPKRQDLMMKLQGSKLKIVSIDQLYANAITLTGEPTYPTPSQQVIGVVRHRDGTILDTLFKRSKVQ
jgi:citrate lyase subunit alpha/citrate CoA-transferase